MRVYAEGSSVAGLPEHQSCQQVNLARTLYDVKPSVPLSPISSYPFHDVASDALGLSAYGFLVSATAARCIMASPREDAACGVVRLAAACDGSGLRRICTRATETHM